MKLRKFAVVMTLLSSTIISTAAFAADEKASASEATTSEIIVTAQKRSQRLLDVPLSVTALTGADIAARQVVDIRDLVRVEPSLQFAQTDLGTPVYTLRGVGYYEKSVMSPPAVSLYQDEVPFAYPVLSRAGLLDLQRVEVLKGPQGTAYGQNATGGAVSFIANKPTSTPEAGLRTTLDNFGGLDLEGFASGPIAANVNSRLAVATSQGGAWQRSNSRNDKLGNRSYWAARLLTDWKPSDTVKFTLNLNGWQDRSDTQAMQHSAFYLLLPGVASGGKSNNPIPDPVLLANGGYPEEIAAILRTPPSPENNRASDWKPGTHPRLNAKFLQAAGRLEWDISPAVRFTSLTSYSDYTQSNETDVIGVGVRSTQNVIDASIRAFFQELRLSGDLAGKEGSWMIGANYSHDKSQEIITRDLITSAIFITTPPFHNVLENSFSTVNTYAAFANFSYPLIENVKLDGGVRYTQSNSDLAGCAGSTDPQLGALITGNPNFPAGACYTFLPDFTTGLYKTKLHENNVAWRAALNWKPSNDILLYVSASKGYKAGSIPQAGATAYLQLIPVKQESLLAYEAGVKAKTADDKVAFTGAVFYYDYRGKQFFGRFIDPIFGPLFALVSIPKSRVIGVEASLVLKPVEGLTIDGAVTHLSSKVTSSFSNFDGFGRPLNFNGERFPYTPEWALQGGVNYEFPVGSNAKAHVGARGSYQSQTTAAFGGELPSPGGVPRLVNKSYALLDLNAGVNFGDRWSIDIWGKNVTNTYYWNNINYAIDSIQKLTGRPATYGVSLRFNY